MSVQSEIETRMREAIFQIAQQLEEDLQTHCFQHGFQYSLLRKRFLPDDFSKLSWDFIREMKDQLTAQDWNAIWNYHTTHENEEREFKQYFELYGKRFWGFKNSYEYNQKELYKNRHGKELF